MPALPPVIRREPPALSTNQRAILFAQIALDRMGFSPGSIDGVLGRQTRAAITAYQQREELPSRGELDAVTAFRLRPPPPAFREHLLTLAEITNLHPLAETWSEKALQPRLAHATLLEALAEISHAHPDLVRKLNPGANWSTPRPGTPFLLPDVTRSRRQATAAEIRISLSARTLQVFDRDGDILAHFPCSIAQKVEKRPIGQLHITVIAVNPDYTFDPSLFPDSPEAREQGQKLILSPGPNNPVGTVWMGLDRPGYGIHGTPNPEDVGRTESKGCFRLANWNVNHLVTLVTTGPAGTLVRVLP